MKKEKKPRQRIHWKRTLQNNLFMLRMIHEAIPWMIPLNLLNTLLWSVNGFLFGTYMYKYVLNSLEAGKQLRSVLLVVGTIFAYNIIVLVLGRLFSRWWQSHTPYVQLHIQKKLQNKAIAVELACFDRPEFYNTYVKALSEASGRAFNVLDNFSNVIYCVFNLVATGVLIITIHPVFLLLACAPLLCTILFGRLQNELKYESDMKNKELNRQKDYVRRTFYLSDFSKEMRLTEMYRVMFRRMHDSVIKLKAVVDQYGWKLMALRYMFEMVPEVFVYFGAILLASFMTLVRRVLPIGDCFVVINSITNVAYSIQRMGNVFLRLDEDSRYIENLRSFLEYKVQIPENPDGIFAESHDELTLEHVSFTYEGADTPALTDVSLHVKAGEKIAIVGHNGAGKTTLTKLLLHLYDPTQGRVLLNGRDVREYSLSSYRNLFGTVFQDYRLFSASVAENVLLHDCVSEDDRAAVEESLRQSGMAEKTLSLPHGIDTTVTREFDKEGAVFSGGEAQKIAIARIFARRPPIVILDEPSSALDPIAEDTMYRNMFAACEGRAVIYISHRLSGAVSADRVYLFEHGQIVEEGTHAELLLKNGKYADMWKKQAEKYQETEVPI